MDVLHEMNARLMRLADDTAVAAVAVRYASGIDRRDFDRVSACFAPGAEVVGTMFSGSVEEYLPRLREHLSGFGATMHLVGNQLREIQDDLAETETYALAHHFADAEGTQEVLVIGVLYSDELARQRDGGWAITRRRVTSFWRRGS